MHCLKNRLLNVTNLLDCYAFTEPLPVYRTVTRLQNCYQFTELLPAYRIVYNSENSESGNTF